MGKRKERKFYGILVIIFLCLVPRLGLGQEKDTTVTSKNLKKAIIMVVPFNPQMYEAGGDQFICSKSGITAGHLSDIFRSSFTLSLMESLNAYYDVNEPIDNLKDPNSDISVLYQIISYKTTHEKLKGYAKEYPAFTLWQRLGPAYLRWGSDCVNNTRQKPNPNHHKYEQATIIKAKDSIYSSIMNDHDASYALFITDFEMTTRFKTCLDLQSNVFQRDFYVHYTLLDYDGNCVTGGVVGITYQSNTNDIKKIIDENIGVLSGMIVANVRSKVATQ